VLPTISTDYGKVEIRRLIGVDDAERDRIETWSAAAFIEEYLKRDPLLLTNLRRESAITIRTATRLSKAVSKGSPTTAKSGHCRFNANQCFPSQQ
jgi:hypothetical protein